jgi:hypothetical protein
MDSALLRDHFDELLSRQHGSHHREPPFTDIENGLSAIEALGPERTSTDSLREDIRWLTKIQRSVEAITARWVAELDDRPPHGDPCHLWMERALQLTPGAAPAQIRTAHRLATLPGTAAALRQGEISGQQATVICRAMEQVGRTNLEAPDVEEQLVDAARRMDPRELRAQWCRMRYEADQEAGLEAEEEQRRRRWLTMRQTYNGTFRLEAELDPEGGALLKTAISAMVGRRRAKGDERTGEQRRADAVVDMARYRLDAGDLPTRGGQRPHLSVVADLATLRLEPGSPLAELDWGPLVTGETARRIACDAAITPVLVDEKGEILHVGRSTRTVPAPTRKALNLRDRHCQGEEGSCPVPAEECTPHHLIPWADGGPSELWNLRLYCDLCHAKRHPENARFRQGANHSGAVQGRAP